MAQQLGGGPRVLGRDEGSRTRRTRSGRVMRDVLEVTYQGCDHGQRASHLEGCASVQLLRYARCPHEHGYSSANRQCVHAPIASVFRISSTITVAYLQEVLPSQASLDGVPPARRPPRGPEPGGDRRSCRARWLDSAVGSTEIDTSHLSLGRTGRRTDRASSRHRRPDARARGGADVRDAAPRCTPTSSRRASPGRPCSPTRRKPSAPGRVVSKLRQVPRLVQAARDNVKRCPGIFVKVRPRSVARRR